jgi:hypothetical protein
MNSFSIVQTQENRRTVVLALFLITVLLVLWLAWAAHSVSEVERPRVGPVAKHAEGSLLATNPELMIARRHLDGAVNKVPAAFLAANPELMLTRRCGGRCQKRGRCHDGPQSGAKDRSHLQGAGHQWVTQFLPRRQPRAADPACACSAAGRIALPAQWRQRCIASPQQPLDLAQVQEHGILSARRNSYASQRETKRPHVTNQALDERRHT